MIHEKKTGVLLLNFGAPEKLAEVEDFITHIGRGKKPPEQVLKIAKEKYSFLGGGSPLNAITRRQAEKLSQELKKQGRWKPVYFGMLHCPPFIHETLEKMVQDGVERIMALSLAPFYSQVSTGAYYTEVREWVTEFSSGLDVRFGGDLSAHPLFIEAWVNKITQALAAFTCPQEVNLVFTTHSLPLEPAEDAFYYEKQFQEAVGKVEDRLSHRKIYLAYQSKGNRPGQWLGPQVGEVMEKLALAGEKSVLVVPIGFAADHLETLYDLDVEIKMQAQKLNMDWRRTTALNDDSLLIKLLAALINRADSEVLGKFVRNDGVVK